MGRQEQRKCPKCCLGQRRVTACMGTKRVPCSHCGGKGYVWVSDTAHAHAVPVPPRQCPRCGRMVNTWEHSCISDELIAQAASIAIACDIPPVPR